MKLLEIYAEDFGCLTERRFVLGEGLNLISGPNESGKSTLLALLRFVLYGFPRKGSGPDGEERDKRLSWQWRRAAGSVTLSHEGKTYTVSRLFLLRSSAGRELPDEKLTVVEKDSGKTPDLGGKTPGEYFLGLPAELYDSSLSVRQSDIDRVADAGTGEAVGGLLFSEGSEFGGEAAMALLQNARRDLQHLKGRGGRVAELEDRISALRDELAVEQQHADQLTKLRADLARHTDIVNDRRRQLTSVNAALSTADLDRKLEQYDKWHEAQQAEQTATARLAALKEASARTVMPDAGFFDRVRGLSRQRTRAEDNAAHHRPLVEELAAVTFDDSLIEGHLRAEEMGGLEGINQKMETHQKKKGSFLVGALTALAIAVVLMVGAFIASDLFLPLLLAGTAVGVLALILFYGSTKHGFGSRIILRSLGLEDPTLLRSYLEQCRLEQEAYLLNREKLLAEEAALAEEETACAELRAAIIAAFAALGRPMDRVDDAAVEATLSQMSNEITRMQNDLAVATMQYEKAAGITAVLAAGIDPAAEAQLRSIRSHAESAANESPEMLMRKREYLTEAIAGLENKRREAERAESALAAVAKDPTPIEAEMAAREAELYKAKQHLAAVNMAMAAMQEAGQSLREGVLPRVSEIASEIFATITEGAHTALAVSERFTITVKTKSGYMPLAHFSAGCRDAAHLAVRLALLQVISKEPLPILMDETLAHLDDVRAKSLTKFLVNLTKGGNQCLLFTCHSRESGFLARYKDINRISL